MVKIRLRRMGAKKHPFYRLVVADARSPRDGRFIEHLGYYDPMTDPVQIKIDVDKVMKWLQQGAQPSEAARSLLKREGILERRTEKSTPTESFERGGATVAIKVKLADEDIGRFIGKAGRNIEAIRTLVRVASSRDRGKRVFVDLANPSLSSPHFAPRGPRSGGEVRA
ncbi:MAG: 30S ribosomal protein S16 [Chloroflexi bacterium]|nr:MAG: 30S ribosomal protein S16 [Chloroflexota bacterium]